MKIRNIASVAALTTLFASACVPSLFPLYTEANLVTDGHLEGSWRADDEEDLAWIFDRARDGYDLAVFDDGSCSMFEARLVALDGYLFLDLLPKERRSGSSMYDDHFLRMHTFYRVEISENRLEIRALDFDELKRRIDEGTLQVKLLEIDDKTVLAEPTPELQKLAVELAATPGAFSEPDVMLRD